MTLFLFEAATLELIYHWSPQDLADFPHPLVTACTSILFNKPLLTLLPPSLKSFTCSSHSVFWGPVIALAQCADYEACSCLLNCPCSRSELRPHKVALSSMWHVVSHSEIEKMDPAFSVCFLEIQCNTHRN